MAISIQQMLDEARNAYHRLMTQGGVIEVRDQNGEMVRYSAMNSARLAAYIAELERKLGGMAPSPMKVWF